MTTATKTRKGHPPGADERDAAAADLTPPPETPTASPGADTPLLVTPAAPPAADAPRGTPDAPEGTRVFPPPPEPDPRPFFPGDDTRPGVRLDRTNLERGTAHAVPLAVRALADDPPRVSELARRLATATLAEAARAALASDDHATRARDLARRRRDAERDLEQLRLDLRQADLDRQRVLAGRQTGEPLASALSAVADRKTALDARVGTLTAGLKDLAAEADRVRREARACLDRAVRDAVARRRDELRERVSRAEADLLAACGPQLAALVVAWRAWGSVNTDGEAHLRHELREYLDGLDVPPPDDDPQPAEDAQKGD